MLQQFYQKRLALPWKEFADDYRLEIASSGYASGDVWTDEAGFNKKGQIIYNEADIVGIGEINNYIWEVKPMGGDPEYQLLKYTQLTGFIRGGYPANNDSGHRLAHINGLYGELDLKMYLSYDGDGGTD